MNDYRPIVCLDFDGVLHSYTSGWRGAGVVSDPPVKGMETFLSCMVAEFRVNIYSSRSRYPDGIKAMKDWLFTHLQDKLNPRRAEQIMLQLEFPTEKPPALVTIDDRAICFDGTWPTREMIRDFRPWNRK